MQKPLRGFPVRRVVVDPHEVLKIFDLTNQHNYNLGLKIGYRKGRQDEREGKLWDPDIERLP